MSASPPLGEELIPLATSLPREVHPDGLGLRVPAAPRSRGCIPASVGLVSVITPGSQGKAVSSGFLLCSHSGVRGCCFFFKMFF